MTMLKRRYPVIAAVKIAVAAGLMWFLIHAGKLNTTAVAGASRHWPILLLGVVLLYLQLAIGVPGAGTFFWAFRACGSRSIRPSR